MDTIDLIILFLLIFDVVFNISTARFFEKLITGLYDDEKPKKHSK